jgi:nuclear pore complex protein Nup98-Nup96
MGGSAFGQPAAGFGAQTSQATSNTVNNGTGTPSFQTTTEKDPVNPLLSQTYHSISAMPAYKTWSFEVCSV